MTDKIYLDDLKPGDQYTSGTYTVTEAQIIAFATEFDPQVFHLDPAAARDTFFAGLAASGWHTAAITMRLLVTSGMPIANGLIGAGSEVSWPLPVRPGDTLHVVSTILDVRASHSKPDRGFATCLSETFNQNGDVVQRSKAKLFVLRRPA